MRRKFICERHTDLRTGVFYDIRKGMTSKTLFLMFGEDRLDNELDENVKMTNISNTCYEVEQKYPYKGFLPWKHRIELISA